MPSAIRRIDVPASNRLIASLMSLTAKTPIESSRSRSSASCSAWGTRWTTTTTLQANSVDFVEPSFDQEQWLERTAEERGAGGRQVLAGALAVLAALWLAYTAWSAGRTLAGQPLSSPLITQWIAVAAGPL